MSPSEFVSWLKDVSMFQKVSANYSKFSMVLENHLKIKRRDQVLIVTDFGFPNHRCAPLMAGCYLLAAKRMGLCYRLVVQKPKKPYDPIDPELKQAIRNLGEDNFIVAAVSERLGSFKEMESTFKRLTTMRRHKFVLTTLLKELPDYNFSMLTQSMDVDYKKMQAEARRIKRILDLGREVRVLTTLGTSLKIGIAGMSAYINDGQELTSGGNIPVGEVFIAPRKNMVEGKAVIDGSVRTSGGTILVKKPVKLTITNGQIARIEGDKEANALRESMKKVFNKSKNTWGIKRIGELGIGLNPNAKVCGPNIINEKALGTAHIAIGSNANFGGTVWAPLHLDQVFHDPQIYVDGKRI